MLKRIIPVMEVLWL